MRTGEAIPFDALGGLVPLWSPDGALTTFRSTGIDDRQVGDVYPEPGVYIADDQAKNGTLVPNTTHLDRPVDWSPDGQSILMISQGQDAETGDRFAQIVTIGIDGLGRRVLLNGLDILDAMWSPTGEQLGFEAFDWGLYIVDPERVEWEMSTGRTHWFSITAGVHLNMGDETHIHGFTASSALLFRRHASSAAAGSGRYLVASRVAPVSMNSCTTVWSGLLTGL